MDDGSYNGTLATNCFSDEECELIQKWFKEKWDIEVTIEHQKGNGRQQPIIYFPRPAKIKFYNIVKSYIIPEMEYKFKDWNP